MRDRLDLDAFDRDLRRIPRSFPPGSVDAYDPRWSLDRFDRFDRFDRAIRSVDMLARFDMSHRLRFRWMRPPTPWTYEHLDHIDRVGRAETWRVRFDILTKVPNLFWELDIDVDEIVIRQVFP